MGTTSSVERLVLVGIATGRCWPNCHFPRQSRLFLGQLHGFKLELRLNSVREPPPAPDSIP